MNQLHSLRASLKTSLQPSCVKLQDLSRALWALTALGMISDESAAALCSASLSAEEAPLECLQLLAAAYLALPSLVHHLPQQLVLQALHARKKLILEAPRPKVRSALAMSQVCDSSDDVTVS